MNVCDELDGDRFQLTKLGEYLRPNHPDSVEARVLFNAQVLSRSWSELIETVRTGEGGGTRRVLGMPLFEYLAKDRMPPRCLTEQWQVKRTTGIAQQPRLTTLGNSRR